MAADSSAARGGSRGSPNLVWVAGLTLLLNALASLTFTAVSVATPFIGSALSINAQDELWLTDAFLIALICVTPLSGYLLTKLSMKRLLLLGALGTTVFFTLGAFAPTLPLITAACFLVGLCSGVLAPATQVLVLSSYPEQERATAMAVWGAGTTLGILAGAALTGFLIQTVSWQSVFLTGVPLGLVACAGVLLLRLPVGSNTGETARADRVELILLLTSILSLGVFLNLGDNYGWFRSPFIIMMSFLSVGSLFAYGRYKTWHPGGVLDFAVLKDAPFKAAAVLTLGSAFFSTGQFEIDLLGGPLAVPPDVLSLRSSLGGLSLLAGVVLGGFLLRRVSPKLLASFSLVIALVGKFAFTRYGPGMSTFDIVWPQAVSGFGLGLLATALAVMAYVTLAKPLTQDGASLFVTATQLGYAFGVAVLGIILNFLQTHAGTGTPEHTLRPFLDIFWVEFVSTALLIPLLLLVDIPKNVHQ